LEILIVLGAVLLVLHLFAKFEEQKEQERRRIDMAVERKRPPILCKICRKPNKNLGDATCEKFNTAGPNNIKICGDCLRKYSFCSDCQQPFKHDQLFREWYGGSYCKNCFEKKDRNFRDTRRAAKQYHGNYCNICKNNRNIEVHHKTYTREGRERFDDLVILCKTCHLIQHSQVHTGPQGGKYVYSKGKKKYITEEQYTYQPIPGDKRNKR